MIFLSSLWSSSKVEKTFTDHHLVLASCSEYSVFLFQAMAKRKQCQSVPPVSSRTQKMLRMVTDSQATFNPTRTPAPESYVQNVTPPCDQAPTPDPVPTPDPAPTPNAAPTPDPAPTLEPVLTLDQAPTSALESDHEGEQDFDDIMGQADTFLAFVATNNTDGFEVIAPEFLHNFVVTTPDAEDNANEEDDKEEDDKEENDKEEDDKEDPEYYVPSSNSSDSDSEEHPEIEVPTGRQDSNNNGIDSQEFPPENGELGDGDDGEEGAVGSSERKKKDRRIFKDTPNVRLVEKRKRECGMAYRGLRRDKNGSEKWNYKVERSGKLLRPPCECKKSIPGKTLKCRQISANERKSMHRHFWRNMTWDEKRTLVSTLVDVVQPKRLLNRKDPDKSRRGQTLKYHLKPGDVRLSVCKTQFLNTFDIKFDFVHNCIKDQREALTGGVEEDSDPPARLSSKARHQNREMREKDSAMKTFLNSLPRMESHYCRQNTGKFYLEPVFTTKMDVYNMYQNEVGKPKAVSYTKFMEEYHRQRLSIYTPRKDLCDTCVSYKAGNCSLDVYEAHQKRKTLARKEKEEDNNGPHFVATVDMQGVLLSPTGFNASSLYYKMKLCVHNFTVFNNKTHHVVCYLWHEAEGGITSNEFATLYVDYIRRVAATLSPGQDVIFWSDGAGYQNRNQNLSNALLKLSSELNLNIIQKYLEVGHTQMECDSVHAQIERKLKNKEIYIPADYIDVIKKARINPFPYEVVYLDHAIFMDYSKLGPMDSIRPGRTAGDPKVNDLRAIKYCPSGQIFYKLSFEGGWTLLEKRQRKNKFEGVVGRLYTAPIKIKEDKFKHLQDLKNVIPKDYHSFYDLLPH